MRDYSKISPRFWTGRTGKEIRALGRDSQVIAMYLMTAPAANMIGLYYLPLPTLCHETGSPLKGALKALRSLSEIDFAHYDEESETVWVPEMAGWQVGSQLTEKDLRIKGIAKEVEQHRNSPFFNNFLARYGEAFRLNPLVSPEPESKPLASPLQAPCKPLRSQEQEQKQKQEQEILPPHTPPGGPPYPEDFNRFWSAYPKKVSKGAALRAWKNTKGVRPASEVIIAKLEELKRSPAWLDKDGRFIPNPATWLNGHGWEDEVKAGHRPTDDHEAELAKQNIAVSKHQDYLRRRREAIERGEDPDTARP